ncbi:hypothetical protein DFH27DRAFT_52352 [Peziza echinospora]|nr:hypothetical protein DFH27DRAFT_52352 [Peziza echinospora]
MASLLGPDNIEMFQKLKALGIDPIYLWFFPPGFIHPRLLDPTGYTPPSLRGLLLGCVIFTTVVSTVALAFRLVSRGLLLRTFGWADGVIIVSWIGIMGTCGLNYWGLAKAGLGYHIYDCNTTQINFLFKYQYTISLLNPTTITITRCAILIFLWEIAPVTEGKLRKIILMIHGFNVGYWIFTCFPIIFQCAPHTFKMWDLMSMLQCHVDRGQYVIGKLSIASAAFGTVLDFVVLVLPIRLVWRLRVPVMTRVGVSAVFAIGLLACIAALVRAGLVGRQFSDMYNVDLSWNLSSTAAVCLLEQCFGMITACAPSFKAAYNIMNARAAYNKSETGGNNSNNHPNSSSTGGGTRGSYILRSPRRAHMSPNLNGSRRGSLIAASNVKNIPRTLETIELGPDEEDQRSGSEIESTSTQNLNPTSPAMLLSNMYVPAYMSAYSNSRKNSRSAAVPAGAGRKGSLVSNGSYYNNYQNSNSGGGPDDLDLQLQDLSGYAQMGAISPIAGGGGGGGQGLGAGDDVRRSISQGSPKLKPVLMSTGEKVRSPDDIEDDDVEPHGQTTTSQHLFGSGYTMKQQ